jgi:hypothetical protein
MCAPTGTIQAQVFFQASVDHLWELPYIRCIYTVLANPIHTSYLIIPTHTVLGQAWLLPRAGQNHKYGAYTVFLAGKSLNIQSYTVYIYGPGQPYSYLIVPTCIVLGQARQLLETKLAVECSCVCMQASGNPILKHTTVYKTLYRRQIHRETQNRVTNKGASSASAEARQKIIVLANKKSHTGCDFMQQRKL